MIYDTNEQAAELEHYLQKCLTKKERLELCLRYLDLAVAAGKVEGARELVDQFKSTQAPSIIKFPA